MPTTTTDRPTSRDTSYHDRRLRRRLEDPEFRAAYERARDEIAGVDAIVNELDALREKRGMTKAELARTIDKNPAAVRRLLTASGNPELRTVIAMAHALGAEVQIVVPSRSSRGRAGSKPAVRKSAPKSVPREAARPAASRPGAGKQAASRTLVSS
jgi:DNA-binding phage protein